MKTLRNRVNLIGNLGMNPEVRILEDGTKMAKVSIATNEKYKNSKGEHVSETQWHNLVGFGKIAQQLETYCKVGTRVVIEGKLVNRQYTDSKMQRRYITEVQLSEIMILSDAVSETGRL